MTEKANDRPAGQRRLDGRRRMRTVRASSATPRDLYDRAAERGTGFAPPTERSEDAD